MKLFGNYGVIIKNLYIKETISQLDIQTWQGFQPSLKLPYAFFEFWEILIFIVNYYYSLTLHKEELVP